MPLQYVLKYASRHKMTLCVCVSSSASLARAPRPGRVSARARAPPRRVAVAVAAAASGETGERAEDGDDDRQTGDDVRVGQVSGEGDALVASLRRCADVTARAFGDDGVAVLDGMVRKIRYSGEAFVLLEATRAEASGEDRTVVGCVDLTRLPAYGPKASKETLVQRVPEALGLTEQGHFAYLSGMAVLPECRRRGVGAHLLKACDEYAGRMDPKPAAIALHVDADNEAAIGLYQKYGYAKIIEREVDDAFGRLNRAFVKAFGSGKKKVLMVRWLGE